MLNGRKIGFFVRGNLSDLPLDQMCTTLRSFGYDSFETTYDDPDFSPELGDAALRKNLETVRREGLTLSEIVMQRDYLSCDDEINRHNIELTKKCIETYAAAGINTLNIFTGPTPWQPKPAKLGRDMSVKTAWEKTFRTFDELVPAAEKYQVSLAVESVMCMLCHDFYTTQYLLSRYDSPYLGVNFDPSHDFVHGNSDMEFMVTAYGSRIKHIHLKDAVGMMFGDLSSFIFPVLGEGGVDWAGFRRGLDEINYRGTLSVEFESDKFGSLYMDGDWVRLAQTTYKVIEKLFG